MARPPALRVAPNKKVGSRPLRIASGLGISSIVSRCLKSKQEKFLHPGRADDLVPLMHREKPRAAQTQPRAEQFIPLTTNALRGWLFGWSRSSGLRSWSRCRRSATLQRISLVVEPHDFLRDIRLGRPI